MEINPRGETRNPSPCKIKAQRMSSVYLTYDIACDVKFSSNQQMKHNWGVIFLCRLTWYDLLSRNSYAMFRHRRRLRLSLNSRILSLGYSSIVTIHEYECFKNTKTLNLACHWASIRDWVNVASVCHVMDDDLTLPSAVDFSMEPLLLFLVFS